MGYCGEPDWSLEWADPELTNALHRWHWLLLSHASDPARYDAEWGLAMMRSWLATRGQSGEGSEWAPYELSERIANALMFLHVTAAHIDPGIQCALDRMTERLARSPEYQYGGWTGNHVINNARALYWAGRMLPHPRAADVARSIVSASLAGRLTEDGFLREGSSHYQFLFTRWLLEMHHVASVTEDEPFAALLEPMARTALERCEFFLVADRGTWRIPLIGDVSPDCPPDWLMCLPWSAPARRIWRSRLPAPRLSGWASLWESNDSGSASIPRGQGSGFLGFRASGWYRADHGSWAAHCYLPLSHQTYGATHAHPDATSLSLSWNGTELIADPGRRSYERHDSASQYAVSAQGHAILLVDDVAPQPDFRSLTIPPFHGITRVDVAAQGGPESSRVKIVHDGFSRAFGTTVAHERELILSERGAVIRDVVRGEGTRLVTRRMPLGAAWVAKTHGGIVDASSAIDGTSIRISADADGSPVALSVEEVGVWLSKAYGSASPGVCLATTCLCPLPAVLNLRIDVVG